MTNHVLSRRALNRALLERQFLLRRSQKSVVEMVEHLVGLQAQEPLDPYTGLWSRIEGFRPNDLAERLMNRDVVRIVTLRGTIHLHTAADCLLLRPLAQEILDKELMRHRDHSPVLEGLDLEPILSFARSVLAERPYTGKELRDAFEEEFPDLKPTALTYACRNHLALVQVPPRGIWGKTSQVVYSTAESWLGQPLETDPSIEDVVLRYLAAFGPASTSDVRKWSGLTGMHKVVKRLRPKLRTFRDENGKELFDVPDAPLPDPDTPAPPRFLPNYDNLLLSHADRTRVIRDEYRKRIATANMVVPPPFLLDGFVAGTWSVEEDGSTATLQINTFRDISKQEEADLHEEGLRLLAFSAKGAEEVDVQFSTAE